MRSLIYFPLSNLSWTASVFLNILSIEQYLVDVVTHPEQSYSYPVYFKNMFRIPVPKIRSYLDFLFTDTVI